MIEFSNVRLATLDQLLETTIPAFLAPPPSRFTVRGWLNRWKVPRFKANPSAVRGGGVVFYSIPHVERMIRGRILHGRIAAPGVPRRPQPSAVCDGSSGPSSEGKATQRERSHLT